MRHSSWALLSVLLVLMGCGDAAEEAEQPAMEGAGEEMVQPEEPACQPSDRMDVVGRASPYDSTTVQVGEGVAKICYGRPTLKGRTMIGGEAVPYDTLWRTGANEPTIIHVNVPTTIAGMEVEPGQYSLYTVPRAGDEWTLIVNRSTSQWGHESTYTEEVRGQEVGRAPVSVESIESPVEQLTFRPMDGGQGVLLEWQNSRVRIPIAPVE